MLALSRTVRANAPIATVARDARIAPCSKRLTKPIGVSTITRKLACSASTKSNPIVGSSRLNSTPKSLPLVAHVAAASKLRSDRRRRAIILAAVAIRLVAVVAGFDPSTNLPVTTPRSGATVETSVGLYIVAIITSFDAVMDEPITAARSNAIV